MVITSLSLLYEKLTLANHLLLSDYYELHSENVVQ